MRGFSAVLLVMLTVVTVSVFVWIEARTSDLVQGTVLEQARSYADLIVATRRWNADHGGVWVEKGVGVVTNPYLVELGIRADDTLSDGTTVTLRNPAVMIREIGDELPLSASGSEFKITSLRPLDPHNAPDAWERQGLQGFEKGIAEYYTVNRFSDVASVFRYMRPLKVEGSCLACHGAVGYQVDDIRGAISIKIPYGSSATALGSNRVNLAIIAALVLVGLWSAVGGMIVWLQRRLSEANASLERMATTDALTGIWNRRYVLDALEREIDRAKRSGETVGVVLMDLDYFKRANDAYGHAAGDDVLRRTTTALAAAVRTYDLLGRIGGEELLVVAPDVDAVSLAALAERLRVAVEETPVADVALEYPLTVSAGTALAGHEAQENADSLVARADGALYAAKNAGRNRVVAG